MFLEQIEIVNFRGIQHLSLKFDKTTVLIGENNTGKSTVLDALQTCLSRSLTRKGGIFSEYDYHLPEKDSQPADSDAIEITLRFVEQSDGEWPDEVLQILGNAVQIDENDRQSVILRVQSKYDDSTDDFVTNWDFLGPRWQRSHKCQGSTKHNQFAAIGSRFLFGSTARLCPRIQTTFSVLGAVCALLENQS